VLEWIRQLYDIEDRARELSIDARLGLRRAAAEPVLDKLEVYLAELAETLLPKSALAKAVTYARNQMGGPAALYRRRSLDHGQQHRGANIKRSAAKIGCS
jgi:hypothetical protein